VAEGGIERTLSTRAQRTDIISSGEQGVLKVVGNPGLLAGHTDHRLLCFQSEYRVRTDRRIRFLPTAMSAFRQW
jgi:hypothetical protein